MNIPELPTYTGCRFRQMNSGDAICIYEINSDRDTQLYTRLLRQQTLEDITSWLNYYPHYQRHGFGLWAIEHNESGKIAGICGLRVRKDLNSQIDISYRMHPGFRRMGIASVAVKTCLTWGFEYLNLQQVLAQVHVNNNISMHILLKNGFVKTGSDGIWVDLILANPLKR